MRKNDRKESAQKHSPRKGGGRGQCRGTLDETEVAKGVASHKGDVVDGVLNFKVFENRAEAVMRECFVSFGCLYEIVD